MDVLDLLAEQVEQSGVRTVMGAVVGDDSFFLSEPYGTAWAWDDLQWGYGAPASALSFADNAVELTVTADPSKPGATMAQWTPNIDYYTLENSMTMAPSGDGAHPGLERKPGSLLVRAWGTVPPQGLHAPLAIEDPAEFVAAAFKDALLHRGVRVVGDPTSAHRLSTGTGDFSAERSEPLKLAPRMLDTVEAPLDNRKVLAKHVSVPVAQDIMVTNKVSQNLHAELASAAAWQDIWQGWKPGTGHARSAAVPAGRGRERRRLLFLRRLGHEYGRPHHSASLYAVAVVCVAGRLGECRGARRFR